MLNTFRTFFTKPEIVVISDTEFYEYEPNSNPNFLTDQNKIKSILKEIEQTSLLCSINFEGSTETFSSSIIDIKLENNQIIIDELLPSHGNDLLINDNKLKLSTVHKGVHLSFKVEILSQGVSGGIAYYIAPIPKKIYYPQRRSCPRIQINSLNIPFFGMSERTHLSTNGFAFDLSRGGVGISATNNIARLQRGDIIKNCRMTLNDHSIPFDLAVRFAKTSPGTRRTLIGGCFQNIPPTSRNQLERFVTAIEREEIRYQKE